MLCFANALYVSWQNEPKTCERATWFLLVTCSWTTCNSACDKFLSYVSTPIYYYSSPLGFQQAAASLFLTRLHKCACCTKRRNKSSRSNKCVIWCNQQQTKYDNVITHLCTNHNCNRLVWKDIVDCSMSKWTNIAPYDTCYIIKDDLERMILKWQHKSRTLHLLWPRVVATECQSNNSTFPTRSTEFRAAKTNVSYGANHKICSNKTRGNVTYCVNLHINSWTNPTSTPPTRLKKYCAGSDLKQTTTVPYETRPIKHKQVRLLYKVAQQVAQIRVILQWQHLTFSLYAYLTIYIYGFHVLWSTRQIALWL